MAIGAELQELNIDEQGWLSVRRLESPNFDARPVDTDIELIVVHGISLPPRQYGGGFVHKLFCNQLEPELHPYFEEICGLKVSAHCLIEREGSLTQFVSFNDRAWHAGVSQWNGRERCNDFSIGIELEGCDDEPYEFAQYQSLARLVNNLRKHYPALRNSALCGHSDIAPGRKTDPGPCFDWTRLNKLISRES